MDYDPANSAAAPGRRRSIAAPWHTLSILLIFGYFSFRDAQHAHTVVSAPAAASHGAVIRGYLISIAYEWGMAYWAWAGVHWKGGRLSDLTGGRWVSWRSLAMDVAIAIPFWGVWELMAWLMHLAVDRVATPTTPYHPPSGLDTVVGLGRVLRRTSFSRLLAAAVPGGNAQHRRSSDFARSDLRVGARLSGLEAGDGNRAFGYSLWCTGGLAAQFARQHNRPRLVRHFRGLVAFPLEKACARPLSATCIRFARGYASTRNPPLHSQIKTAPQKAGRRCKSL